MKKLSKLLALALTLCMILSCISVVAFAAETDSYESTILSLNSAEDVTNYTWAGNAATGSWDATENAFKFVSSGAPTGTRFQTNYYYFRLVKGADYTLTLKVKGVDEPGNIGAYVVNSNDYKDLTATGNWKVDNVTTNSKTKGATDENGYTEWTYALSFDSMIDKYLTGERLAYSGVVRFFVNMPNNEKYTAYVKDLKLVANKSQGEDYVTTDYMFLNQYNIPGVPLFRYGDYCYTDPVVSADTDGDKIWNLALQKEKLLLGEAYTFDANTKYRLSFDAWLDESAPSSYESKTNIGIMFDSTGRNTTQSNFSLAKTRKHYGLVFDTTALGEASAFSTANLQLRIGAYDFPEDYIFNITDIRLQKFTTNTVDTLVKVNGGGAVKKATQYTTYALANGESLPVVSGTPITLDVAPNSGYQIASITYNNVDITPADRETASQITITPTSDAVLNVKFEVIPPKIPTLVKGANQKADSFTIGETVYNNVNYIQYAKIDNYSALDVAGAGITISDGTNSLELPAVSIAADGSFAIRVFGNAITEDGTYTFTPYMNVN